MCVCASSKCGLNGGLCPNVHSTAAIVGDCHGRPDSETLKTHLINHVKTPRGPAQNLGGNLAKPSSKNKKKEPKFSLTPRVILTVFFSNRKKKEGWPQLLFHDNNKPCDKASGFSTPHEQH
jgi:hypothetical protein